MIDLNYEPFLARIEVHNRKASEEDIAGVTWRVRVVQHELDLLVLAGYLKISDEDGLGRAISHGFVMPRFDTEQLPDLEELLKSGPVEGCVEAMYDIARRSLNMQAAMMDFAFDLPYSSPETTIRPKRRTPEPA